MKLSGGERQKVFLAKALAQDTKVMLLDEPITYLDLYNQIEMLELLHELAAEGGKKILTIMHDINLAYRYSEVCLMLKEGELYAGGKTVEVITEKSVHGCFNVEVEKVGEVFSPKRIRSGSGSSR
jgi:iron complex transport system ATP-binding protein